VNNQVGRGEIASQGKARANGALIHYELIVIPAQAGIHRPFADVNQILNVGRLLEIGTVAGERETGGSTLGEGIVGIARTCGDDVGEVFVKEKVVGFDARLPFVAAAMEGDAGV
jgi:hypothetical protein